MSPAIPVTLGKSPKISLTFFQKTSCAQPNPKGSRSNLYLPNGELKVVQRAPRIEKDFAPLNFGRTSSSVGVK